jgi:hypothetical protein
VWVFIAPTVIAIRRCSPRPMTVDEVQLCFVAVMNAEPGATTTALSDLLRQRLQAQAGLFAALTSHPTLIGSGREGALGELLRQFIPRRFEVLSGTVAIVDSAGQPVRSTHQLDLIIADTMDFPTLLRSGDLAVVLAPSVRAAMEVKSGLKRGVGFLQALVQIARARQFLNGTDPVFTGLFSFGFPEKPETLRDWLQDVLALRTLLNTQVGEDKVIKLRDKLLKGDDAVAKDEAELQQVLGNDNLPDVIAADRGAVARKGVGSDGASPVYTFLDTEGAPPVIVLIDQLVKQLSFAAVQPSISTAFSVVRAYLGIASTPAPDLADLDLVDSSRQPGVAS